MTTLNVGQWYDFTAKGSDGSTIPNGALSAVSSDPSIAEVVANPEGAPAGTVTAIGNGAAVITFSAAGYKAGSKVVNVHELPSIIVNEGPINTPAGGGGGSGGGGERAGYATQERAYSTWTEGLATATQADGKVLVAGCANLGPALSLPFNVSQFHFAWFCSRYNADGTPDIGFGSGGTALVTFGDTAAGTDDECTGIAVLANGKILLAGIRTNRIQLPSMNIGCARLNADGSMDATFGTGGTLDFAAGGSGYFEKVNIGVQASGTIAIMSSEILGGGDRFQQWLVSAAGVLQSTQGVTYNVGSPARCYAATVDASDRLVCGGYAATGVGAQWGWFISRVTSTLAVDHTFGGEGADGCGKLVTFQFDKGNLITGIHALADGKYLATGLTGYDSAGHQQLTLARFTSVGQLDATFGVDGIVHTNLRPPLNLNQSASWSVILASGKIMLAGASVGDAGGGFSDGGAFLLARYTADGVLDATYGAGGYYVPTLPSTSNVFYNACAAGDKFYACGHTMDDAASPRHAIDILYKFGADGLEDKTFGNAA